MALWETNSLRSLKRLSSQHKRPRLVLLHCLAENPNKWKGTLHFCYSLVPTANVRTTDHLISETNVGQESSVTQTLKNDYLEE